MGALLQAYRQEPRIGLAQALGELADDRKDLEHRLRASGDNTVRVPAVTLSRIAGHLTDGAQAEAGSEALQAALWRTAGRLQRWVAEAAETPPTNRAGAVLKVRR